MYALTADMCITEPVSYTHLDVYKRQELSLQCQSIREDNDEEQREAMLRAIRGQMNGENGRKMDIVLKMMEARRLAAKIR